MGTCHEQKADRTRFIIEEDLKIKEEMLQSIKAFTEKRREEQSRLIQNKPKEEEEKVKKQENNKPSPQSSSPNAGAIIFRNRMTLTEEYEPVGQLGEGGYGQVYLVRHKKMNL